MKGYTAFMKKEFMEYIRTYKILMVLMVFLALGFLNPITAKYLPELVVNFLPEGMSMDIPEPGIMDSWTQFFKNVPQMGLIVMLILSAGTLAGELKKGTLIPVFTKGVSKKTVLLAKITGVFALWGIGYGVSFCVTYGYSYLFWNEVYVEHLGMAALVVWIFGLFLLSLVLLGSVVTKSSGGGLIFAGGGYAAGMVLALFGEAEKYSPVFLVSKPMSLLEGSVHLKQMMPALWVTLILTAAISLLSVIIFQKNQL